MTSNQLDLTADIIDVRDIIERIEELESDIEALNESEQMADQEAANEAAEELQTLTTILDDLKGYGGDKQWRGDGYPVTLINECYWVDYVQELLEDCGEIPRNLPHYIHIDWEATAREVKADYSEVTIDGVTFFYR